MNRGGAGGGFNRGFGGYRGGYGYGYGGRFGFGLGFGYGYPYYGYPYYGYGYGYGYPAYGYGYGGYADPYYYGGDGYYNDNSSYGYYPDSSYGGGYGYGSTSQPPVVINQQYSPVPQAPSSASESYYRRPDYYLIAFNDHTIQAAVSFSVDGDQIRWTTREHVEKSAPLSSVDRRFSEQINRDRHVDFHLP